MTPARMRRLASDYEEVKKNFAGHKNIIVTPVGDEPPEKYNVTYFVNGIYLLPDGKIETLGRHEVEITLHADYPRYKPICKILTPIWHPNFRDGQICIGDIWGAGESLSDIIVNIGDMIQYKSWNSYSPLSADAAQWAMENKHLFPVGNIDLFYSDYSSAKDSVEIDLFDEVKEESSGSETKVANEAIDNASKTDTSLNSVPSQENVANGGIDSKSNAEETTQNPSLVPVATSTELVPNGNDFEITAEELEGIEFIPTAQRMQTVARGGTAKVKVNFKTVLQKGILWALIGALVGFAIGELLGGLINSSSAASLLGYSHLSKYFSYSEEASNELEAADAEFKSYCKTKGIDPDSSDALLNWYKGSDISSSAKSHIDNYISISGKADDELYDAYQYDFGSSEEKLTEGTKKCIRVATGLWSAIIALFIGLSLGIGEGIFYGSKENALKYGAIGAGISVVLGFFSGDLAQLMYSSLLGDDPSLFMGALTRGAGWAIMGLGIGLAIGLIRFEKKRILFCSLGGLAGAFLGGFLFDFICKIIPNDMIARGLAILIMGILIGVGVGLLEQFAKQAWLKVIRGEFEGKEYLVFAGTTSIGNNGKNTIVLFKDKLVGPHHCDIVLEGSKYVLIDCGTPMGTVVNGMKTSRHILRNGDAISVGNSVLVFYTK